MTDHEKGPCFGLEQRFEPEDTLDIQMVRGFVQEKDVRFKHERADDGQTLTPPAGERGHRLSRIGKGSHAQGLCDTACMLVRIVPPGNQDLIEDLFDRLGRCKGWFLRHIRGLELAPNRTGATIRFLDASENLEQGRFAGAVRTDQAHMIAVKQGKREIDE